MEGVVRFLNRVKSLVNEPAQPKGEPTAEGIRELQRAVHQALRKVSADLERFSFNTVVSTLMELSNTLQRLRQTAVAGTPEWRDAQEKLVLMLAPIAPHQAEELWEALGNSYNVPAVWTASDLGPRALLDRLHDLGLASLDGPSDHYGVALALGA